MKKYDKKKSISDNPSYREIQDAIPIIRFTANLAKVAGKLGFKGELVRKMANASDLLDDISEALNLPDRFNAAFSDQGWIATSSFSAEIMREAVELHEEGKQNEAEGAILSWFSEQNIQTFAITRARKFHDARLRDDQLREALKLYCEERYWGAVPLILIACDGFASDVSGGVSPFKDNADLSCFDSVTGHSTSLPALMEKLVQGVRKSSDENLSIPKRHGILHGRSLGYANKIVCAKAWLLMVSLVDWAGDKSSEKDRKKEWEQKKSTSFRELTERIRENERKKQLIDKFKPYEIEGQNLVNPDKNSAEFALMEFLERWKCKNYGRMSLHVFNLTKQKPKKMAGEMRKSAELIDLVDFEIVKTRHSTIVRCEARVKIEAKVRTKRISGEFEILVFLLNSEDRVAMPDDVDSKWLVQQNCIIHIMNEKFAKPALSE